MSLIDSARPCPGCGDLTARRRARPWLDDRFTACTTCGLVTLADPPTDDELPALYQTGLYSPGAPRAAWVVGWFHRAIGRVRMRTLPKQTGRLADVGSGKGHFLDAARRAGWDVVGIEISEAAAAEAKRRYGLQTIVADWSAAEAGGQFDAVTMWHVLEHLPDPVDALRRARPLLRPDGVVVVSVPNLASWQARLFGNAWLHLDVPRHLLHFTPATMRQVAERAGYRIDRLDTIAPEMEALGVVQSIQNRVGIEPNLALRFLKRDRRASGAARGIASLLLAVASLPIALGFVLVAGPLGRGASLQVVCRPVPVTDEREAPSAA